MKSESDEAFDTNGFVDFNNADVLKERIKVWQLQLDMVIGEMQTNI